MDGQRTFWKKERKSPSTFWSARVTPHQNRLNTVRVCYQTEYIRAFVGTVGVTQVWCPRSTSQLDASSPTALRRGPVAKVFRFRAVHKKKRSRCAYPMLHLITTLSTCHQPKIRKGAPPRKAANDRRIFIHPNWHLRYHHLYSSLRASRL